VAGGDDIARFTCLDMLVRSFLDFGTGWIIADMFLAMKNEVCLLQKKFFGVQPFIAVNKTNKTESKSKTVQEKHIEYEAIKI
jgi:hypothetical protein